MGVIINSFFFLKFILFIKHRLIIKNNYIKLKLKLKKLNIFYKIKIIN
jgi:hypothetical protein